MKKMMPFKRPEGERVGITEIHVTIPASALQKVSERVITSIDVTPPDEIVAHVSQGVDVVRRSEPQAVELKETKYIIRYPRRRQLIP